MPAATRADRKLCCMHLATDIRVVVEAHLRKQGCHLLNIAGGCISRAFFATFSQFSQRCCPLFALDEPGLNEEVT